MKKFCFLALNAAVFFSSLPAKATDSYLQDEIDQIKSDIVVIQRQLYREKSDTTAPKESVSNFQVRLGEYDQMIRDMNGKVENVEYRLKTLEKKLETFDKDIDLRFEQIKKQMTAVSVSRQGKNGQKAAAKPLAKPAVQTPKGIAPKNLYEAALTDLKNNKLTDAETKLNQFLTSYPKETLAGNAQYWLGEVYYKQQNFAKAAVAFKDGYSKYPQGAKGADCLLKLGLSMKALGKKEEACTAFVNLPTVFDKVNADIAARAKKEAEALDCK